MLWPLRGFTSSPFTWTRLIFSDLAAPTVVKSFSLRFRAHLPLLDSLFHPEKKNPVLFSTALSELHPSLPSFTIPLLPLPSLFFPAFTAAPPSQPQSSPCVFLPSSRPPRFTLRASPSHPYLSNLPVGLLSLWKHDLQPSNSRLYTAAFSSCSRSSLWTLHTQPCIQSAPTGHGPASKITWGVKHQYLASHLNARKLKLNIQRVVRNMYTSQSSPEAGFQRLWGALEDENANL